MQVSHSRVECFESCKFKYRLRYVDKLLTLPPDNADNALVLGHALHTGLEEGLEAALTKYNAAFPIQTDDMINEMIKLEYWIPRARELLPEGDYEVPILTDAFVGYIDLRAPIQYKRTDSDHLDPQPMLAPNLFDLYDFKYTSNGSKYRSSPQLHLYKYFYEKTHPGEKIRNLNYFIIPKVGIKRKKDESLEAFRDRIEGELSKLEIKIISVEYDPQFVIDFLLDVKKLLECKDYPKEPNYLCNWCDYKDYCQKGVDYMILPKNERRNIEAINKKVVWLYGAPFVGKTFFANAFPSPLMLNTDGNIKFIDAPFIPIKDKVEMNGRLAKRTFAWDVLKEVIDELEKKENTFKTIVVDLVEDCYESCRLYMYAKMGITHESDDPFKAWDKVRTEFLSTMRKLTNLPYENILLISHEDTSKDVTKKGGDKLTAIKPNIQDKVANKLAGMVDIVARVVADGDNRTLSFKTNELIFGGGRLIVKESEIPLDYETFLAVYEEANKNAVSTMRGEKVDTAAAEKKPTRTRKPVEPTMPEEKVALQADEPPFDVPAEKEAVVAEEVKQEAIAAEEAPDHYNPVTGEVDADAIAPKPLPPRTRKRRGEA